MRPKARNGRKLLVASIGVATMTYVGVQCGGTTSSNGGDGGSDDAKTEQKAADAIDDFPVANLVAPPVDAGDAADAYDDLPIANLVPPPDAGMD